MPTHPPAPRPSALFVAEPPAQWHIRAPLVVDCSVLVSYLFEEHDAVEAAAALRGRKLHAPALLPFEFANVARSKSRAGGPALRVHAALEAFESMSVELHAVSVIELHELALRYALSAYDAAYLWLAGALKAPLATFDQRLGAAAAIYLPTLGSSP